MEIKYVINLDEFSPFQMSKRALKKYLDDLDENALKAQIIDLYERIPQVKTFYDFVFNPKEDKLVDEAKIKISNEYFPTRRKRPRKRRSIAQKYVKQFKTLGMEPALLADVMLFNIEIVQTFTEGQFNTPDSLYKSMLNSFQEAVQWLTYHSLLETFGSRVEAIIDKAESQKWPNAHRFEEFIDETIRS